MKEMKAVPYEELSFEFNTRSLVELFLRDNDKDTRLTPVLPKRGEYVRHKDCSLIDMQSKIFRLNDAINRCLQEGTNYSIAYSDMKAMFRNLRSRQINWPLLLMKGTSAIDGKVDNFVDKCLPFGKSIPYTHFQAYSDTTAHTVEVNSGNKRINYLDAYLFAALFRAYCNVRLIIFFQFAIKLSF